MSVSPSEFFYADVSYVDTSNALINFSNLTGNAELNEHPLSKYARGIFFSPNYNKQFFDAINWANNLGDYKTQLNLINPFNNSILENLFANIPSAYPEGMIAYYVASDINIENNSWPDRSGNNNATLVGTGFSISTDGLALQGTTSSSILFGNILNTEYTICSITSYSGTNNKTILNSADTNWIHGHYNGRSGVIAYELDTSQQLVSLTPFKSLPDTYLHTIPASPELSHDQLKAQPQKYTINPTGWNGFSTTNDWSILISSNGVAEMLMRWGDSWGTPISYIIDNFNSPPAPAELSFTWKPPGANGLSIGIESPQVNGNVVPFSFVIAFDSSLYQSDSTNLTSITTGVQGDGAAIKLYRKVENGEWERPDIKSFSYNNNLTEADYNQFTSTPMVIPYYNASWANNGTGDIRIDEFNLYNDVWTPPAPPAPVVHPQPLEPGVSNLGVPIPAENENDSSGWSVAISANGLVLVVGDRRYGSENKGRAQVYDWNVTNSVWQIRENTNIIGEEMIGVAAHEHTGCSVATSADGNVIAVGDIYHDYPQGGAGRVRVWDWNTTDNKFHLRDDNTKLLYGFNGNEQLGKAISLSADGTIIAIGSHYWDKPSQWDQGMVRVFKWNGVSWSQLGNNTDIQGVSASDHLGESVALSSDGTILAVGVSHVEVPPGSQNWNRGEIHVYTYNNNIWNKRNMDSSYQGSNDYDILGWSIAISSDGNIVAAGGNNAYGGQGIGFVRIWEWNSNSGQYDKRGSDLPGNGNWKHFGHSVDLSADGKILVVGAAGWNQNLEGYVEVYMWNDIDEYIILTDRIIGSDINGSSSSQFGHSVSLNADGTILAVGAPTTSAGGHTYTFNVTYSSGSSSESNDWTVTCGTNAIASDGTQSILVNGNNITPVSEQEFPYNDYVYKIDNTIEGISVNVPGSELGGWAGSLEKDCGIYFKFETDSTGWQGNVFGLRTDYPNNIDKPRMNSWIQGNDLYFAIKDLNASIHTYVPFTISPSTIYEIYITWHGMSSSHPTAPDLNDIVIGFRESGGNWINRTGSDGHWEHDDIELSNNENFSVENNIATSVIGINGNGDINNNGGNPGNKVIDFRLYNKYLDHNESAPASVYGSNGNISVNINNGNSSDFSDFAIKELIVWPRALTTDEMKSVSDYMIANLNSPVF